jgi:hypothetical protein
MDYFSLYALANKSVHTYFCQQSPKHKVGRYCINTYTYSSSASVAWQSLLLALISIDGPLHYPLIHRVDASVSSFLTPLQPTTIFHPTYSAMSMTHAHVLSGVENAEVREKV